MATAIAACTANGDGKAVLYRNLKTQATLLKKPGEDLPAEGTWEAVLDDNTDALDIEVYVGAGPVWLTRSNIIKLGDEINVRFVPEQVWQPFRSGLVRIIELTKLTIDGREIQVEIEHLGGFDPTKLVHHATLIRA